jgi:uncharacterized C2H2 Zn-finger protein
MIISVRGETHAIDFCCPLCGAAIRDQSQYEAHCRVTHGIFSGAAKDLYHSVQHAYEMWSDDIFAGERGVQRRERAAGNLGA